MPGGIAEAGDMWFGHRYDYTNAQAGNYAWHTILHEIGHSLGLKHGNEAVNGFAALPAKYDSLEYTVMTYRTYPGGPTDGYSYSQWSAPQTYMMADIAALQHMYGADFTTNSGDTVYRWDSTSGDTYVNGKRAIDAGGATIFATVWDGGGRDTYDLSGYSSDLHVNLAPGQASLFAKSQLASFGSHQYASGNIYNALQYDGDSRSLIENAIGGRGDDVLVGNIAGNKLSGSDGDDRIRGQSGADILLGGDGNDWLAGGEENDRLYGGEDADRLLGGNGSDRLFGADGNDRLDGGDGKNILFGGDGSDKFFCELGANMLTGGKGRDLFVISGGVDTITDFDGNDVLSLRSFGFSSAKEAMSHAEQVGHDVVFSFGSGSVLTIEDISIHDLTAADFLF